MWQIFVMMRPWPILRYCHVIQSENSEIKTDLNKRKRFLENVWKRLLVSSYPSVRLSAWNNSARNWRNFMKFHSWGFFKNLSRKVRFYWTMTRTMGTLREDLCTFIIMSRWILRRMRNDKFIVKIGSLIVCWKIIPENHAVCEIIWQNVVERNRPQMTIQYGACIVYSG
jgi:hypothetical protein